MLKPIKGNPGRFLDTATGQVLNIAEYREDDKYDSVFLPGPIPGMPNIPQPIPFGSQFIFFRDITNKRPIDCNFTQQSRLSAGEEMVIDRLGLYIRHIISGSDYPFELNVFESNDTDVIRIAENGFFRVEVNQILLSEGPAFKYSSGYGLGGHTTENMFDLANTIGIGVPSTAAAAKLVKTQVLTSKYEVIGYLIFHNHDWILDEPDCKINEIPGGEIAPLQLVTQPGIIVTAFLHGLIKSAVNK